MMLCGNRPQGITAPDLPYNIKDAMAKQVPPSLSHQTSTTSHQSKAKRQAAARTAAAKSKSKLWGPSHSFDSDDDSTKEDGYGKLGAAPRQAPTGSWWETIPKAWVEWGSAVISTSTHSSSAAPVKRNRTRSHLGKQQRNMEVLPEVEEEDAGEESTDPSTDDSNEHRLLNQTASSGAVADSRSGAGGSGAGHHPSLNDTRTTASTSRSGTDLNTSRDTSSRNTGSFRNGLSMECAQSKVEAKVEEWTDLFSNACGAASPCSAHDLEELFGRQRTKTKQLNKESSNNLGIAPLQLDNDEEEDDIVLKHTKQAAPQRTLSEDSPAERRRQRNQVRRQRHEQASASISAHEDFEVTSQQRVLVTPPTTTSILQSQSQLPPPVENKDTVLQFPAPDSAPAPLETLLVKEEEAQALERSISELTMRSSYQEARPVNNPNANNDQRRMAYYAVGRHHRLTSGPRSGGNRRCYFTGKLIFGGGAPFYAGIVQQGLRTLVVFCLPSALGMPHNLPNFSNSSSATSTNGGSKRRFGGLSGNANASIASSVRTGLLQRSRRNMSSASIGASLGGYSKTPSRLSSTINFDDMSLSIEGDIDPNWNLDKDYLLRILPDPSEELLAEMNQRYPEQFETLPVQVRHASCWRLFVKFCFFSGLPIAEGELHYQVRPKLALELYGEDIVLSHEVMEAVNGASSAEILKLPNLKTFRYLKKQYQQQSAKLPEVVFQRASWEQVKPEV